jgi:hypothetical protein
MGHFYSLECGLGYMPFWFENVCVNRIKGEIPTFIAKKLRNLEIYRS